MALVINEEGSIYTQLPVGASYDSYQLTLFVQVIDDLDAITVFTIPEKVTCLIKNGTIELVSEELLLKIAKSDFTKELFSGNSQLVAINIISFTSILNNPGVWNKNHKF